MFPISFGSFSAFVSLFERFTCFRYCFQYFLLCLDIHVTSLLSDVIKIENQKLLSRMPSCDYCKYARQFSGCYEARQFVYMAVDGDNLSIYDFQGSARELCVWAHGRQWRAMSRSCPNVFLNMLDLCMLLVLHGTEVKYVRSLSEILRTDISLDRDVAACSCCCLPCPFRSFYLYGGWVRAVKKWTLKCNKGQKVCLSVCKI